MSDLFIPHLSSVVQIQQLAGFVAHGRVVEPGDGSLFVSDHVSMSSSSTPFGALTTLNRCLLFSSGLARIASNSPEQLASCEVQSRPRCFCTQVREMRWHWRKRSALSPVTQLS